MDDELLKKLLTTVGVDPAKIPDALKTAQGLIKSSSSGTSQATPDPKTDKLRDGLIQSAQRDVDYANSKEGQRDAAIANVEGSIAARLKSEPRRMITSSRQPVDTQENRIRAEEYSKAGLTDPASERRASSDLAAIDKKAAKLGMTRDAYESMDPIDRMREESAPAQQRAAELKARSEAIRSVNADSIKENLKKGNNAFEGMQSPARVKEGQRAVSNDEFAASMEAQQQFQDTFSLRGAQGDVIRAAGKEGKAGEVYDALKQSRADNLQKISQDRIASGAKPVGSVQSIEADGRVLAQRTGQEEGARVASGGIDGAIGRTVDGPGKMELTKAGQDVLANRTYTATSTDGTKAVAGAYGTAIGGKLNFPEALTPEQRTGEAPLSEANQKYKDSMLAGARDTALKTGALDSTSAALAKAMPAQAKDAMGKSPIAEQLATRQQDAIQRKLEEEKRLKAQMV